MTLEQLETRLSVMEKQLADIRTLLDERLAPKKSWDDTFGMFAGDPMAQEVAENIRKAREADRRRARRTSKARGKKTKASA